MNENEDYDRRMEVLRADLVPRFGADNVWDTDEVVEKFDVVSFLAHVCFCTDRETEERVVLTFNHHPRLYWRQNYG